jgi:site-specific DNA-adenine methylase
MRLTLPPSSLSQDMFEPTADAPQNVLLYIDPPYKDNTYGQDSPFFADFDTDGMWALARRLEAQGNRVFVSEYAGPADASFVELAYYGRANKGREKKQKETLFGTKEGRDAYEEDRKRTSKQTKAR